MRELAGARAGACESWRVRKRVRERKRLFFCVWLMSRLSANTAGDKRHLGVLGDHATTAVVCRRQKRGNNCQGAVWAKIEMAPKPDVAVLATKVRTILNPSKKKTPYAQARGYLPIQPLISFSIAQLL